jgi:hypothetical protein
VSKALDCFEHASVGVDEEPTSGAGNSSHGLTLGDVEGHGAEYAPPTPDLVHPRQLGDRLLDPREDRPRPELHP